MFQLRKINNVITFLYVIVLDFPFQAYVPFGSLYVPEVFKLHYLFMLHDMVLCYKPNTNTCTCYTGEQIAYIPPERERVHVGSLRWSRPPMRAFLLADTNKLVSKNHCGPNANPRRPNTNPHGPNANPNQRNASPNASRLKIVNIWSISCYLSPVSLRWLYPT